MYVKRVKNKTGQPIVCMAAGCQRGEPAGFIAPGAFADEVVDRGRSLEFYHPKCSGDVRTMAAKARQ